jgi:hypothetical protein
MPTGCPPCVQLRSGGRYGYWWNPGNLSNGPMGWFNHRCCFEQCIWKISSMVCASSTNSFHQEFWFGKVPHVIVSWFNGIYFDFFQVECVQIIWRVFSLNWGFPKSSKIMGFGNTHSNFQYHIPWSGLLGVHDCQGYSRGQEEEEKLMIPLCFANGWIGNWPGVILTRLLHVLFIEGMIQTNPHFFGKSLLGGCFSILRVQLGCLNG